MIEDTPMLPENFDNFKKSLIVLSAIIIITIPLFAYIFGEDLIFFLPLVAFVVFKFNEIRNHINLGTTSKILVNKIIHVGVQLAIIWIIELGVYVLSVALV